MNSKNYIEFRVYFKDNQDIEEIKQLAEDIKDELTDGAACEPTLTQDVTYEIILNKLD